MNKKQKQVHSYATFRKEVKVDLFLLKPKSEQEIERDLADVRFWTKRNIIGRIDRMGKLHRDNLEPKQVGGK